MENDTINQFGGSKRPRLFSGLILLAAGVLLLAYKAGAPIPAWVFTWPVLLIGIGTLMGIRSRFHNPGSYIMIAIGVIFLIDQSSPDLHFHNYILPAILICVGLVYIVKPGHSFGGRFRDRMKGRMNSTDASPVSHSSGSYFQLDKDATEDNAEYVDINAVFGGVKKIILSKNFKGGEINSFMGGTEINLLKADIQGAIVLEVNNVFGGTKLMVPSNWDVKNEVTAVFGGIEDKRNIIGAMPDAGKIMILKGTCVFGGIEVANF